MTTSPGTTKTASDQVGRLFEQATQDAPLEQDTYLRGLKRPAVLGLPVHMRLRWYYLMQVVHAELRRVTSDLLELLEPNNEVSIISIIGMTGIGKTTFANSLRSTLAQRFFDTAKAWEVPVIYVSAPANGERSLSWTSLYTRILEESNEPLIHRKRATTVENGKMKIHVSSRTSLADLRSSLDSMLLNRGVRILIVDEALHLLRFSDYSAVMDTLKSLADNSSANGLPSAKLLLIGSYGITPLMQQYAQVSRRSEIIHYQRYHAKDENDAREFRRVLAVLEGLWPCEEIPNLSPIGDRLMDATLGSVGLLKGALLRLAFLQMKGKGERFNGSMLAKSIKSIRALANIESETLEGEEELQGAAYGESMFADRKVMDELAIAMTRDRCKESEAVL